MPRTVSIAGHPVRVVRVRPGRPVYDGEETDKSRDPDTGRTTDEYALGVCQFYENRIAVSTGQAVSQERDTLLHEVLHALVRANRLHRAPFGPLGNHDKEELAVALLATSLLDTLRRNPSLAAFLLDRDAP